MTPDQEPRTLHHYACPCASGIATRTMPGGLKVSECNCDFDERDRLNRLGDQEPRTGGALMPKEFVYRRYHRQCCVCAKSAHIVLHVGTGGNYREVFVCEEHDRKESDDA